jgi:iron-sulfur cluster assembly protein
MGAAEFPLARRTKRERFGCVKGFLKNKFLVLQTESLSLAQEFIFGFEFPCGWLTLPGEMITLTESAAAELKRLLAAKGETEGAGLCLAVRKGGCAGWQYEMRVGQPSEGDVLVEDHGARVIVAADSVERLRGCEVDFSDDLTDSGFKVHNPRAARSCGCGTSFESLEEPARMRLTGPLRELEDLIAQRDVTKARAMNDRFGLGAGAPPGGGADPSAQPRQVPWAAVEAKAAEAGYDPDVYAKFLEDQGFRILR